MRPFTTSSTLRIVVRREVDAVVLVAALVGPEFATGEAEHRLCPLPTHAARPESSGLGGNG
jgi:hypothetical protein